MSTHVPGLQSFFQGFLHLFVFAKLATSSIRIILLSLSDAYYIHISDMNFFLTSALVI